MSSERDPDLERWAADARGDGPAPDLAGMFAAIERDIATAEKKPTFWLRSRSTTVRRAIAFGAAALLAGTGALGGLVDPSTLATSAVLAVVLAATLYQALRPMHRPSLSRAAIAAFAGSAVVATLVVALAPLRTVTRDAHALGCFGYGATIGALAYAVARLLDRGGARTPWLAGGAATLVGNLGLELHCAGDVAHRLLGHFTITLFFLAIAAFDVAWSARSTR